MHAGSHIPETDSVLTSTELQQLLEQEGIDLRNVPSSTVDSLLGGPSGDLTGLPGGSGQCYYSVLPTCSMDSLCVILQCTPSE